jgi:hypothetical protein
MNKAVSLPDDPFPHGEGNCLTPSSIREVSCTPERLRIF